MAEITISGTLEDLIRQTEQINAIVKFRKVNGWVLFQEDENWIYETQEDERVCPICNQYGLNRYYLGNDIPTEFPDKQVLESTSVYPNIHTTYPFLKGDCRCNIWWSAYMATLTERLGREMQEAIE